MMMNLTTRMQRKRDIFKFVDFVTRIFARVYIARTAGQLIELTFACRCACRS